MGDVISLEQYRRRLARRSRPAAAGGKKPAPKAPPRKGGAGDKPSARLELPAGEPPKKES